MISVRAPWNELQYSGISLQQRAKELGKFVHYKEVSLGRGSFSYILPLLE